MIYFSKPSTYNIEAVYTLSWTADSSGWVKWIVIPNINQNINK